MRKFIGYVKKAVATKLTFTEGIEKLTVPQLNKMICIKSH